MRNSLIINGKSVCFPFSNFGRKISADFAPVCAGFERRANRRFDPHKSCFHQPLSDRVARAHGATLRARGADARRGCGGRSLLWRVPQKGRTRARHARQNGRVRHLPAQRRGVYEIVPNCRKATLQAVIRDWVALGSTVYSDGWGGYDGLAKAGYRRHLRVAHGRGECVRGEAHINGIEGLKGLRQNPPGEVPRHKQTRLLSAPQRMRVPVQSPA